MTFTKEFIHDMREKLSKGESISVLSLEALDEIERLRKALENIFLTDIVSFVHTHYRGEYPVEFAVMNLQEIARRALNEVETE